MENNNYSLEDLIEMLEDLMASATRIPFGNGKASVDINRMSEVVTDMRMAIPMEIQHAQKVVLERNNIIAEAKQEAEDIIRKAEQRRREILDNSDIIKEAHRRAAEFINVEQNNCAEMRIQTVGYVDNMLKRIEDLLVTDVNDLRKLRSGISSSQSAAMSASPMSPVEKPGV